MENVVSLKAVRTEKECVKLFVGYKNRVIAFTKEEMALEIARFQKEMHNYPNHLLTLVKGRILLNALIARGSVNPSIPVLLQTIEDRFQQRRKYENDRQARA